MTSGPGSRSSQNLGSGASPELFGSQADAPAAVFDIPTRRSAVHSGMVSGGSGGELRKSSSFLSRVFQREDKHAQAGAAASDTAVASAERGGVPSTGAVPRVISGVIPGSFRHEGHIGLGDDGGFDVHNIPKVGARARIYCSIVFTLLRVRGRVHTRTRVCTCNRIF